MLRSPGFCRGFEFHRGEATALWGVSHTSQITVCYLGRPSVKAAENNNVSSWLLQRWPPDKITHCGIRDACVSFSACGWVKVLSCACRAVITPCFWTHWDLCIWLSQMAAPQPSLMKMRTFCLSPSSRMLSTVHRSPELGKMWHSDT